MSRSVKLDWDLENVPVEIKTESEDKELILVLYSHGTWAGAIHIYSWSTPQYWFENCMTGKTNFPTSFPSAAEKIWRITLDKSAGIRVKIHCNGEQVLNVLMSDQFCVAAASYWKTLWGKDVDQIEFYSSDTASDYYRRFTGNF